MNRKVLLLAGAISALFAGKSAITATTPAEVVDIEQVTGAVDIHIVKKPTPAPVKSTSLPAGEYQVAVHSRAVGSVDLRRFYERPMRRKVKYGKNRWVILG